MELRQIRYFIALAEELNFSRAAERLHISQPPLSRQIQELENEIGTLLFDRTSRQVELTNAGKVFLEKAYHILDQVEQAYVTTRLSSSGIEGELRIGFTGIVQDLVPTLNEYRKLYPKITIILKQMNNIEQIEALNDNIIDIGCVSTPIKSKRIDNKLIKELSLMATVPENHPLASKSSITVEELAKETFIMTPKSTGMMYYEIIMSIFKKAGLLPNVMIQAHDLQTVLELVASGMGVTISPQPIHVLHGIIRRPIEGVHTKMEATLIWRKDNNSPLLTDFLQFFNKWQKNGGI